MLLKNIMFLGDDANNDKVDNVDNDVDTVEARLLLQSMNSVEPPRWESGPKERRPSSSPACSGEDTQYHTMNTIQNDTQYTRQIDNTQYTIQLQRASNPIHIPVCRVTHHHHQAQCE